MFPFDPMILTDLSKYTADLSRPGYNSSNQHPHLDPCVCTFVYFIDFLSGPIFYDVYGYNSLLLCN